jgi:glycosyltransferase involved in cell wall biosynthesis
VTVESSLKVDMIGKPGETSSGIDRYVDHLSTALIEQGVDVQFAEFRYLPGARWRSILKSIPIGLKFARPQSIAHIPQIAGSSVLLGRKRIPAVVTVHDLGALDCLEDRVLFPPATNALFRLSMRGLRKAQGLIAVSEFTRRGLISHGFDPGKITTVYEGVDHDRFRPIPDAAAYIARKYGIDLASRPTVLYVGTEYPRKNLATLVSALAILKQSGSPVQWVKVGAPWYGAGRAELDHAIASKGLLGDVRFVEHVPDEDLPYFYAAATVYVQPSTWEGFGLPVLEAMACGTPVVASNSASLPEVCGSAGILVPPMSATDFADAIGDIATNPTRACDLSSRGQARAGQFTWAGTAAGTTSVYQRAAG